MPTAAQLHKYSKTKGPVMHSKPIKYPQDGSGRDYYIKCTDGGLSALTRKDFEFKHTFKKNLRTYERIPDYLSKKGGNGKQRGRSESTQAINSV